MHTFIKAGIVLAIFIAACVLIWAYGAPVKAQDDPCVDVVEDKAKAEASGITWLGVFALPVEAPPGSGAVFYTNGVTIFVSPVVDGCVLRHIFPIGNAPGAASKPAVALPPPAPRNDA